MKRTRRWVVILAGLGGLGLAVPHADASRAARLDRLGRKAEERGDREQAFSYYSQAMAAAPNKAAYRQHAQAVAAAAINSTNIRDTSFFLPLTSGMQATESVRAEQQLPSPENPTPTATPEINLSPEAVFDSITARELDQDRELLPPVRLSLPSIPQDYAFEGDSKSLFEKIAAQLHLQVVFDRDFVTGRPLRFRLSGVPPREALHALEASTNTFAVPISQTAFLVAIDTEAKRKELEQVATFSIPMPSVLTVQEITELGQAVKQAIGIDKIYWDAAANQIIVRDRVSRAMIARSVLEDLIGYRAQIAIDLEFIELSETELMQLGADLQTSFSINFLGQLVNGKLTTPATLRELARFSLTKMFGVGIANADVIAELTRANARNLLRTTLVSVENQKGTFHAGSKYPIITSQFVGPITTGGQVYQPPPSFTFEDLGIVVNVTPHAHTNGETTLDLDTEYKILGAPSTNGLPIISNRKLQSTLRLRPDQWAVVAGLTSESKSITVSGPAFLSNVPLLGHLISHWTKRKASSYVLISIKPHLMSLPPGDKKTHEVYVGSETRSVTPL